MLTAHEPLQMFYAKKNVNIDDESAVAVVVENRVIYIDIRGKYRPILGY
tara:strand:+ start:245 stop:391 length:147 start_codon:yes stop_codon:yes gene_type:complete